VVTNYWWRTVYWQNYSAKVLKITVYDPLATDSTKDVFGDAIDCASSIKECLSSPAWWIFALPCNQFRAILGLLM